MLETDEQREALLDKAGIRNPFRYGQEAAADFGLPAQRVGMDPFRNFIVIELRECADTPDTAFHSILLDVEEMKSALGEMKPNTNLHPFFSPSQVCLITTYLNGAHSHALLQAQAAALEYLTRNTDELLRLALAAADERTAHSLTALTAMFDEAARQMETAMKFLQGTG